MDIEKVHLGFTVKDVRDGRMFSYKSASASPSFWIGVITLSFFVAFIVGFFSATSGHFLAPFLTIFLIGIGLGWMYDVLRQTEGDFIIRDQVIEVSGRRYDKADISEILVRNISTDVLQAPVHRNGSSYIVMGTGVGGTLAVAAHGVSATAQEIGNAVGDAMQGTGRAQLSGRDPPRLASDPAGQKPQTGRRHRVIQRRDESGLTVVCSTSYRPSGVRFDVSSRRPSPSRLQDRTVSS